jgi:hypothetical protein
MGTMENEVLIEPHESDPGGDLPNSSPTRRSFLKQSGLLAASGLGAAALGGLLPKVAAGATTYETAPPAPSAFQQLAENAVIFGGPAVLFDNYRKLWEHYGFPYNRLRVGLKISTPQTIGVEPNVDTLYGYTWLDLTRGPVVIQVPATGDRYYSWEIQDMWGNTFAYIGTRATGNKAGVYALTPPGWRGKLPQGVTEIKATTKYLFTLTRTLLKSPSDLSAARKVVNSFRTGTLKSYPNGLQAPVPLGKAEGLELFPIATSLEKLGVGIYQQINQAILRFPPLPVDAKYAKTLRPVGVDVKKYVQPSAANVPALEAAIAPAVNEAAAALKTYSTVVNGWSVNLGITPFIHEPLKRFALTYYGVGANINEEALYFNAAAVQGQPLTGANTYEIVFPKGQLPPVDAFWSVILYGTNLSLVPNPIDRYAVTSHTPGVIQRPDGSLSITVSTTQPSDPTTNWLPSPAGGFLLILRTYLPKPAVLKQTWNPPAIQKL